MLAGSDKEHIVISGLIRLWKTGMIPWQTWELLSDNDRITRIVSAAPDNLDPNQCYTILIAIVRKES
jgi:hypothetical protein